MNPVAEKVCGAVAVWAVMSALHIEAQTVSVWTNTAAGVRDWSGGNWSPATPANGGSADTVLDFGVNAGSYTANNDFSVTPFSLNRLAFGAGTVTLTGNPLRFVASGAVLPAVTNASGNAAVVNNDLVLDTNTVFCAVNAMSLNGRISGAGQLVKAGAGTLTLTNANGYAGGTLVVTGILAVADGKALGTGRVTVADGGRAKLYLSGGIAVTNAAALGREAPAYSDNLFNSAGDNMWDGPITVNGSKIGTAYGSTLRLTRGIVGNNGISFSSSGLIKVESCPILLTNQTVYSGGGGTVRLDVGGNVFGSVAFWGGCTLTLGVDNALPTQANLYADNAAGGRLNLNGFSQRVGSLKQKGADTFPVVVTNSGARATLTVAQDVDTVFAGLINGPLTLVKTGSGTLTLTNASAYGGGTVVSNGTLRLGIANALLSTGAVTVAGGTYDLGGFEVTNGAVTVTGGAIANGTLRAGSVTLSGACSVNAVIGGPGGLSKDGSGTALLQRAMTYAGETVVSGGTLKLDYLPDGTVACYGFNDASALGQDSGALGNTLKTTGGTPQYSASGKFGGALYLDGGSKLGTVTGLFPAGVPTGGAPYTVAAFIRAATDCQAKGGWIGYGNQESSRCNNFRLLENSSFTGLWNYWWGNDRSAFLPGGSFTDGWHSVVGTWDGTTRKIHIDGTLRDSVAPGTKIDVGTNEFVVGRTIGDAYFTGWVDNLLIVNRALSSAEVSTFNTIGLRDSALPSGTALRVSAGAVMDLNGAGQTVAALSGGGVVTGGLLTVTGRVSPGDADAVPGALAVHSGLTLKAGVTNVFDCTPDAADIVHVAGTLRLEGSGTVQVSLGGAPVPPSQVTLFTFSALAGGANLLNWTVTGISGGYRTRLAARGSEIVLTASPLGTLFSVR